MLEVLLVFAMLLNCNSDLQYTICYWLLASVCITAVIRIMTCNTPYYIDDMRVCRTAVLYITTCNTPYSIDVLQAQLNHKFAKRHCNTPYSIDDMRVCRACLIANRDSQYTVFYWLLACLQNCCIVHDDLQYTVLC
uniref:Proteophosphoglycan ppg4 n=1 Tax=Rhodotorula toruloides (strain NP11) TaxID=1130832 RepID=A0A7G8ZGG4_RHOT1|nr:hypothetical protein JR093_mgp18 [Rhodotorula toruloides]YP_009988039.1 hypothetical protein JR093_mgp06 [Rhodotorula toruloides]QNL17837.1 hypothetical protein [Rhodotorula toruloides]QNL17849.1 hypothetical protein [Rhodotorula toruloides]CAE5968177.1 hypothetical protein [Rhodotorula toruloides]CAE5968209.1 hypothetical protein [Rhodotorula toruloides]